MHTSPASKLIPLALVATVLSFSSGCGLLTVEMTSTPDTVRRGDLVTFDIKLTNRSQCPLKTSLAMLVPFISASEFEAEFSDIPPDAPPELLEFIEQLRQFFDDLCNGGHPPIPTPPIFPATTAPAQLSGTNRATLSASCRRNESEILCEISGHVQELGNGMTFGLFGDRLHCTVDDAIVRCDFSIPLPQASMPFAVTAAAIQSLTCLTPQQLGIPDDEEFGALCFIGTFPMFQGLGPNEMATGQVKLPAHGSGVTRNLVIAMSDNAEDAGVCKGGGNAGAGCTIFDSEDCPGSTCGEGICVGGDNDGLGCDAATQMTDCPNGGTCHVCANVPATDLLPIDCTTTYVSPEPAPAMSPWGLAGLAVVLFATGAFWLQRRRGRD